VRAWNQQVELGRDADRAGDFEGGSRLRDVPHGAVDGTVAKLDGAGLEHTLTQRYALLLHRRDGLLGARIFLRS